MQRKWPEWRFRVSFFGLSNRVPCHVSLHLMLLLGVTKILGGQEATGSDKGSSGSHLITDNGAVPEQYWERWWDLHLWRLAEFSWARLWWACSQLCSEQEVRPADLQVLSNLSHSVIARDPPQMKTPSAMPLSAPLCLQHHLWAAALKQWPWTCCLGVSWRPETCTLITCSRLLCS